MVPLPFQASEYHARLSNVRNEMAKRQLDLLIVNDVANQHYLTAYDGWSFYTPQVVIVPIDRRAGLDRPQHGCGWRQADGLDEAGECDRLPGGSCAASRSPSRWTGSPAWIADKGWGKGRIGIELEAYYYSPKAHARLTAGAAQCDASSTPICL